MGVLLKISVVIKLPFHLCKDKRPIGHITIWHANRNIAVGIRSQWYIYIMSSLTV